MMDSKETHSFEIEICRFRGGDLEFLGMVRIYPMESGIGLYARDAQPYDEHDSRQVRGFVACDPNQDLWVLVEKATAWAAGQMEPR